MFSQPRLPLRLKSLPELLLDLAERCLSQSCPLPVANLLGEGEAVVTAIPQPAQQLALWLRLALLQGRHGFSNLAGRAVAESEQLQRAAAERATSFPLPEQKLQGRVGLAVSAATYEETTANAVASFDLYKPWPRNDFEADLFASINYDSSRDFNLTWPISQGFAVYRHRLDRRNFLFIDQLSR